MSYNLQEINKNLNYPLKLSNGTLIHTFLVHNDNVNNFVKFIETLKYFTFHDIVLEPPDKDCIRELSFFVYPTPSKI